MNEIERKTLKALDGEDYGRGKIETLLEDSGINIENWLAVLFSILNEQNFISDIDHS